MNITAAGLDDLPGLLRLYDKTIEWLVANGRPGQWGTRLWSTRPVTVERITSQVAEGRTRLALVDGQIVGTITVDFANPDRVTPAAGPQWLIQMFAVDPAYRHQKIGPALLESLLPEARAQGITVLRVIAYTGAGPALADYYKSQGFHEVEPYSIGRDGIPTWHGVVLERPVA